MRHLLVSCESWWLNCGLPGRREQDRRATRLPKASVANVYDVQKVLRVDLLECLGTLPQESLADLDDGLRLALDL